jgi:hypothetical protein
MQHAEERTEAEAVTAWLTNMMGRRAIYQEVARSERQRVGRFFWLLLLILITQP